MEERTQNGSVRQRQGSMSQWRRRSTVVFQDTASEVRRLTLSNSLRVSKLLSEDVVRLVNERRLVFPESPTIWDTFWVGLLVVFVFSVVPGLFYFASRAYPSHWRPMNETLIIKNLDGGEAEMDLFETAGYGVVTPLSKPMHSFFFVHVFCACLSSCLLPILFTTGRVMRWRLADGTISYDSADDLHRILALWSSLLWMGIIVTGALTIPLLHPTLQVANYAELAGVFTMFTGALISAYTRQWVIHRLCAWGLIYSATASVFVGVCGRLLQAYSALSAYEIKAIGYTVAFCVPIVGLVRDIWQELKKLNHDHEEAMQLLASNRHRRNIDPGQLKFVEHIKPFKGARSDKMRRLSLYQHITKSEPNEEYSRRRSRAIGLQNQLSPRALEELRALAKSESLRSLAEERDFLTALTDDRTNAAKLLRSPGKRNLLRKSIPKKAVSKRTLTELNVIAEDDDMKED